jgi:hypothetical protein
VGGRHSHWAWGLCGSREVFTQLAQTLRNPVALKPVHGRHTLRLPPDEYTLTTPGWQVRGSPTTLMQRCKKLRS